MKYPVIYVRNVMGVHKHNSISYALHMRIVSGETEDELRAAYLKKLLSQLYHTVEGLFVVAQAQIVKNDNDPFILFTSNLDQRMLKMQLQTLANELGSDQAEILRYLILPQYSPQPSGPGSDYKTERQIPPLLFCTRSVPLASGR